MDEYKSGNVGLEAGRLPDDLKNYRSHWTIEDVWGAIFGIVGASLLIGYVIGRLSS
jgi:hypothetical protein